MAVQRLLRKSGEWTEVQALLQQHAHIRPAPARNLMQSVGMILYVLLANFYVGIVADLLAPPKWPLKVFLGFLDDTTLQVVCAVVLLMLAGCTLAVFLRLPANRPEPWYLPLLLVSPGVVASLAGLFLIIRFVPIDPHLPTEQQSILQVVLWVFISTPLIILSVTLFARKQKRMHTAEARNDLLRAYLELAVISLTPKRLLKPGFQQAGKPSDAEKANAADIPRFLLARHPEGDYTVAFSADLPISVARQLAVIPPEIAFTHQERIKEILAEDAPCEGVGSSTLYTFPDAITSQDYADVTTLPAIPQSDEESEFVLSDQNAGYFARVVDEQIVALCRSKRMGRSASEAWVQPAPVDTDEARQVTLAWAYSQQYNGRVPFFTHASDDAAAAVFAHHLGLRLVVKMVEYY
jgi:hypothetical protein